MPVLFLLLAAIASAPTAASKPVEDFWFDVPHGSFPSITKYRLEGKLPKSGEKVGALFRVQQRAWQVTVERQGRSSVRLQVGSERRGSVHFGRALLWASGVEQELRIRIPYGPAQIECFANGNDVFASVYLIIPRQGRPQVHESRFENCKAQTEQLVPTLKDGRLVVEN